MTFTQAIEYIHGTNRFGSKLGLENIKDLMARLGDPQKRLRFVHVAGTNGKGSTVAFLSNVLLAAGYRCGSFTSPFIQRFNERIKINNQEISDEDIAELTASVKAKVEDMLADGKNHPTEFEIVTALAFMYYERVGCDVVVLEVGLGGRLDASNVIDCPVLAVITTLSLDHVDILGSTLSEIAFEKAGIIKDFGDVLVYPQEKEAMAVIEKTCLERNATLWKADFSSLVSESFNDEGQQFSLEGLPALHIALLGEHQLKNAALAVKAAEILCTKGFEINEQALRSGLLNAKWQGRFERVHRSPAVFIDGAHNVQGAKVLCANIQTYFPGRKIIFVAGVLADKDYKAMFASALPLAKAFFTVTPYSRRALDATVLADYLNGLGTTDSRPIATAYDDVKNALHDALTFSEADDIVFVFGSLYFLGEVRAYFGL